MNWSLDSPSALMGLLLLIPTLIWHGQRTMAHGRTADLPRDLASSMVDLALRVIAALAVLAAVLGIGGLHRPASTVERVGTGAHIVVLLDRSASMADSFAGSGADAANEAKGVAAARLLDQFVASRQQDMFGVVLFSTAPLHALNLTADGEAVRAAIATTRSPGIGLTNISAGLALALEQFRDRPMTGSRVVMLVSDGAAQIDPQSQGKIRRLFAETGASLHWVFLRTAGGSSPSTSPSSIAGGDPAPEYLLDQFFRDLGRPYRLYEAENSAALSQAVADVGRLQNLPLRYLETLPRDNLASACYALACLSTLLLLVARLKEIDTWAA